MIKRWLRFQHFVTVRFGTVEADKIRIYQGDMFDAPEPTDYTLRLSDVTLLTPVVAAEGSDLSAAARLAN